MSQFPPALSFTLDQEDRSRKYKPVPDTGGFAIAGVNSATWPAAFQEILAAPQLHKVMLVSDFYLQNFWVPWKYGGLNSQDVANRVFDEGVNASPEVSIKLLQICINLVGEKLQVDGSLGPLTLEAANNIDEDRLLAAYRSARLKYYQGIIKTHPEFAKYLDGWEKRAMV